MTATNSAMKWCELSGRVSGCVPSRGSNSRRDLSPHSRVYNDEVTTEPAHQDEEASSDHCRRHRYRFGVGYQVNAALAQPSSAGTAPSFCQPVQRSRIVADAEALDLWPRASSGWLRLSSWW
jgi:hypothetical protein